MIKSLHFKRWPECRKYEIVKEGVKIEFKTHDGYNEQLIKFEEIGFDEQITRLNPSPVAVCLFISVFFNLILALLLFIDSFPSLSDGVASSLGMGITIALSIWARELFKFEKSKIIKGNVHLPFWYFKKYKDDVDAFIESLKMERKSYFREKYLKLDEFDDSEIARERFLYLKHQEYITSSELQEWIEKLEQRTIIRGFQSSRFW